MCAYCMTCYHCPWEVVTGDDPVGFIRDQAKMQEKIRSVTKTRSLIEGKKLHFPSVFLPPGWESKL